VLPIAPKIFDFWSTFAIFVTAGTCVTFLCVGMRCPFENITGLKLPVDQEVECEDFVAHPIDDTVINDNQSGLRVAPMQDTMPCVANKPLEPSTTVVPPKTPTNKRQ
jgi:hypothetical protein